GRPHRVRRDGGILRLRPGHYHGESQPLRRAGKLRGAATYLSGFASSYGLATQDLYCSVHPSLPNYLCLSGASDFGCQGYDGNPQSNSCTNQAWQATNIVDRLETNGLTWKAYMEDMPSNCYATNSGNYAVRHNPFV